MTMTMDLIRHIAGLYSGKAIKGDFTQVYITGNEIWMAQQILASQHTEQAEGAQGERIVQTAPERIYLIVGAECPRDIDFSELTEVSWCENDIDDGIEYVRADKAGAVPAAQAGQVPQAWLDVQAERRRQVAAEGWTPEHDNEHDHGQMARAAACYALAGSSAADDKTTALLVSLAWPWDQQWWKPTTARRDLVKACALTLAEIERLDRAAAPTAGGSDA
ncbi:hypothetical protein OSS47_28570 [Pseudomonas citronellolis]|jgi:hypothetical protein|uniref:hypothetical protein n=1 Tax=Pseudomonas citronellolis TaxID=53408 RepID=UPI00226F7981|nr:hypothetical protein [Pseudomonas citronellolis]WAB92022.1 hypothetical protein OSS47_28570 [Pseudomonas citronellolis]